MGDGVRRERDTWRPDEAARPPSPPDGWADRRERLAWAMFDFANSGYTTVVLTTVYNAYFVSVVAARDDKAVSLLLWTVALAISNGLVLLTAPAVGALADDRGAKKRFLAMSTIVCVLATGLLGLPGSAQLGWAITLLVVSNVAFGIGEDLVAAFLPEMAPPGQQGRLSALGWSLGYLGGLLVLGLSLLVVTGAEAAGWSETRYVPAVLALVAMTFALAALPTFVWLRERAPRRPLVWHWDYLRAGLARLSHTVQEARRYQDLFRFLVALAVYHCGVNTVVVVAAVYAQQVVGLPTRATIALILVVNLAAALGAFLFGRVQDRLGSVPTLAVTLLIWLLAALVAVMVPTVGSFWLAANLVGIAMGSSQSAGRALVAQFSPVARAGEFLGLWGSAVKLAAIVGPLSYGLVNYLVGGNQRLAMLATSVYFLAGLGLLSRVDERRGRMAAQATGTVDRSAV